MATIEELKKKADDKGRRGKSIKFADGNTWVIPTMPLKLDSGEIKEFSEKAMAGGIQTDDAIKLVYLIVRLNYPDAQDGDINPDLESLQEVIMQYTGQYLGK